MKNKITILLIAFLVAFTVNAQEKKIKFSKGTLKICSSKNFKIEGYNGSEVIIKSLHDKKNSFPIVTGNKARVIYNSPVTVKGKLAKVHKNSQTYSKAKNVHSNGNFVYFSSNNSKRKKG